MLTHRPSVRPGFASVGSSSIPDSLSELVGLVHGDNHRPNSPSSFFGGVFGLGELNILEAGTQNVVQGILKSLGERTIAKLIGASLLGNHGNNLGDILSGNHQNIQDIIHGIGSGNENGSPFGQGSNGVNFRPLPDPKPPTDTSDSEDSGSTSPGLSTIQAILKILEAQSRQYDLTNVSPLDLLGQILGSNVPVQPPPDLEQIPVAIPDSPISELPVETPVDTPLSAPEASTPMAVILPAPLTTPESTTPDSSLILPGLQSSSKMSPMPSMAVSPSRDLPVESTPSSKASQEVDGIASAPGFPDPIQTPEVDPRPPVLPTNTPEADPPKSSQDVDGIASAPGFPDPMQTPEVDPRPQFPVLPTDTPAADSTNNKPSQAPSVGSAGSGIGSGGSGSGGGRPAPSDDSSANGIGSAGSGSGGGGPRGGSGDSSIGSGGSGSGGGGPPDSFGGGGSGGGAAGSGGNI